jgi:hypothetical protein
MGLGSSAVATQLKVAFERRRRGSYDLDPKRPYHPQSGNNAHLQNISPGWLRMETDERVDAETSWPTSAIRARLEFP